MPTVGSLFSGYDGLGLGLSRVMPADTRWFSDFDPKEKRQAPDEVLAHHWPHVPNLGDITQIDWSRVPSVDVMTGGFPCQDLSLAGERAGLHSGTRSGLWSHMAEGIAVLRPKLVIAENVRGLLSGKAHSKMEECEGCMGGSNRGHRRALGTVLGDLAKLGYNAEWVSIPACSVGAPHRRSRVFVAAYTNGFRSERSRFVGQRLSRPPDHHLPAPDALGARREGHWALGGQPQLDGPAADRSPAPDTRGSRRNGSADSEGVRRDEAIGSTTFDILGDGSGSQDVDWGRYGAAVARWERILGRRAPSPTHQNPNSRKLTVNGGRVLSPEFVEWMMGLPTGHVTSREIGLTRSQQLKTLGNGVVPQQAAAAIAHLLQRIP